MPVQVIMPKLGESVVDGTILKWLKREGDAIEEFESLLEVETAKVVSEIPSPASGTVLKILAAENVSILAGEIIAWIGSPGEAVPEGMPRTSSPATAQPVLSNQPPGLPFQPAQQKGRDLGFISPVVAKIAHENNIDLALVKGTGDNNRITKKDILAFIAAQGASELSVPAWETPGSGDLFKPTDNVYKNGGTSKPSTSPVPVNQKIPGQVLPLTSTRIAIAEHMVRSKHTSAHVTTVMEADLSRVVLHRDLNKSIYKTDGVNLTFTAYFILAAALSLKKYPLVNSSWTEQGILLHKQVNIGVAVSLGEDGLIVPVIRDADRLSLAGLARSINDLADRGRRKALLPDEVSGGTFSITNHGLGRSLFATPVINQPQCAILGVGAIQKRAIVVDDAIAIRSMVYLSLTFDHRILDGSTADAFLGAVVDTLQTWQ